MNPDQWMVSLSSLSKAAARKDRKTIASYLAKDADDSTSTDFSNWDERNNTGFPSGLKQPTIITSTLLNLLFCKDIQNDTTDRMNAGKNGSNDDNLDTKQQRKRQIRQQRQTQKQPYNTLISHMKYFSNVHILPASFPHDQIINYEENNSNKSNNGKSEEKEKQQKFQLSMSFRSLLLLPSHHAAPWETIKAFVNLNVRQWHFHISSEKGYEQQSSLFAYYFFHDTSFALGILHDIKDFFTHFCNELLLVKSQPSEAESTTNYSSLHGVLQHANDDEGVNNIHTTNDLIRSLEAIEVILMDTFSTLIEPIFSKDKWIDLNENMLSNQHYLHRSVLFEIIPSFIETSKSIDILHHQINSQKYYHFTTMEMKLIDSLFPSLSRSQSPSCLNTNNQSANKEINTPEFESKIIIRPDMILPLLTLTTYISQDYMNVKHWNNLRRIISNTFLLRDNYPLPICYGEKSNDKQNTNNDLVSDFIKIFQVIITIIISPKKEAQTHAMKAMTSIVAVGNDSTDSCPSWIEILIRMFYNARINSWISRIIELKLEETIINLQPHFCNTLVELITQVLKCKNDDNGDGKGDDDYLGGKISNRTAACLNLLLIILRGQQKAEKQTISQLLAESMDIDVEVEKHYMTETINVILSMHDLSSVHASGIDDQTHFCKEGLRSFFKVAYYDYNDRIKMLTQDSPSQEYIHSNLDKYVQLVYSCLSFYRIHNKTNGTCQHALIVNYFTKERIQRLIDIAQSILETNGGNLTADHREILFSVAIFVTLFVQVPLSRTMLVQHFTRELSKSEDICKHRQHSIDPKHVICWTISYFVNTCIQADRKNDIDTQTIFQIDEENLVNWFQPLCNLLAYEKDSNILNPSVRSELTNSLSSLQSAREALIKMVSQNLQMTRLNELDKNHSTDNQEYINIAIEGLSVLIQEKSSFSKLADRCTIDDVGLEALIHISNLIVLNRPIISFRCRSFLLSRLIELARNCLISDWVAKRILASTLMALLQHFRSSLSQNLIFAPQSEMRDSSESQTDVTLLIMLTMILIQYNSDCTSNRLCLNFSYEEVDILVPSKRIPKEASKDKENQITLRSVALSCFGSIIMYATQIDRNKNECQNTSDCMDTYAYQQKLCQMEIKDLEKAFQCRDTFTSQVCCDFLNPALIISEQVQLPSNKSLLYPSIYDSLISILMGACNTIIPKGQEFYPRQRTRERIVGLLVKCSILQSAKQKTLHSCNVIRPILSSNEDGVANVTHFFLNAAAVFECILQDTNKEADDLNHVKIFINALKDFCDATQSIYEQDRDLDENTFVRHIESTRAVWLYYNSSCNEIRCCDLIDFIEAQLQKQSNLSKHVHQRIPGSESAHKTFSTTEETYEIVRGYRFSFMSCLGMIFQSHLRKNVWKNNKDSYFLFCVDIACTLSQDLCSGLNGMSGGMTQSLYRCYIQTIEDAVQAALQIPNDSVVQTCSDFDKDLFSDLKNSCVLASTALWDVISAIEIKSPTVFKSTVQICSMHLPQLYRRFDRIALSNIPSVAKSRDCILRSDGLAEFKVTAIINDCLDQLKEFGRNGEKKRKKTYLNKNHIQGFKGILASNKRLLDWTFDNSIAAIERFWAETWQLLLNEETPDDCCESAISILSNAFDLLPSIEMYSVKHLSVVKQSMSAIMSLLTATQQSDIQTTSFEELSFATKRRLCSCMERMFVTLKTSIRFISKYMTEIEDGTKSELNLQGQVAMAESISCVIGWLTTPNFTLTVRKYHAKLVAFKVKRKDRKQLMNDDLNHARVTKIIHKIEELEKTLSQFLNFLRTSTLIGCDLDKFTRKLAENLTMTQIIHQYLSHFQSENSISCDTDKSEIKSSGRFNKVDNQTLRKRLREARKEKKRSQNVVVDEWMYLDCELEEESRADDNFEDLEDFLLPG